MRRITSIKNAIKYFKEGIKVEERKNSKGEEYNVYIPPVGFHSLKISEHIYDTKGRVAGVATQVFRAFQYKNYVDVIERKKDKIVKLVLCYE